jgi:hypothetical protein
MNLHDELSNPEILTLAVYLRGGAVSPVDLEDAAIEAFNLAPKKFNWKKYEDQIDLRIIQYALQDACKPKIGYLKGSSKHGFMLTQSGLNWAENYDESKQLSTTSRKSSVADLLLREQARLRKSHAFEKFINGNAVQITLMDFREFARVNDYFPEYIKKQRYHKIDNVVENDQNLKKVWTYLKTKFVEE